MAEDTPQPDLPEIPDKPFFKIGEVADIVGVKPYILRYWETEFQDVSPRKTPTRHRQYDRNDIELLLHIKSLLYDQMYTVAGARKRLQDMVHEGKLNIFFGDDDGDGDGEGEGDVSHLGDALDGADQAVMEQELCRLRAATETLTAERDRALETATMATDALREVEAAHAEVQREARRLRAELDQTHAALNARDKVVAEARADQRALRDTMAELEIKLQSAHDERDAVLAAHAASAADASSDLERVTEEAWLREAQQAAVSESQRRQKELRDRLQDHIARTRKALYAIREETIGLSMVVHADE